MSSGLMGLFNSADTFNSAETFNSADTHFLNYYLETLWRRLGGNTTEPFQRLFNGSRMVLHDRGNVPVLNHAITNSGLTLFHM